MQANTGLRPENQFAQLVALHFNIPRAWVGTSIPWMQKRPISFLSSTPNMNNHFLTVDSHGLATPLCASKG